jgi:hypothetical protein
VAWMLSFTNARGVVVSDHISVTSLLSIGALSAVHTGVRSRCDPSQRGTGTRSTCRRAGGLRRSAGIRGCAADADRLRGTPVTHRGRFPHVRPFGPADDRPAPEQAHHPTAPKQRHSGALDAPRKHVALPSPGTDRSAARPPVGPVGGLPDHRCLLSLTSRSSCRRQSSPTRAPRTKAAGHAILDLEPGGSDDADATVLASDSQGGRNPLEVPHQRDASIVVDECRCVLHLPIGLDDALAEARSYPVSLTLAHQHCGRAPVRAARRTRAGRPGGPAGPSPADRRRAAAAQ